MLVLGIETSCDETGLAVYDSQAACSPCSAQPGGAARRLCGVVPELASRDHIRKIVPLARAALAQAGGAWPTSTASPTPPARLMGALLVGAGFGRSLAWTLGIPALGIHHMEAHLLAPLMDAAQPPLPFVALLVSGGHTQLVEVDGIGAYTILGESLDDAAGEAFDKAAKMLGLGYPGGPHIARCAVDGDPVRFHFPRPMTDRPGLDFSFSGLKTFTLNTVKAHEPLNDRDRADIARCFEEAVVDTLAIKCRRAIEQTGAGHLVIAGGVSANVRLRERLESKLDARVHYAEPSLCTDNGAMVAFAGCQRLLAGETEPLRIVTRARWPMTSLAPATQG